MLSIFISLDVLIKNDISQWVYFLCFVWGFGVKGFFLHFISCGGWICDPMLGSCKCCMSAWNVFLLHVVLTIMTLVKFMGWYIHC